MQNKSFMSPSVPLSAAKTKVQWHEITIKIHNNCFKMLGLITSNNKDALAGPAAEVGR